MTLPDDVQNLYLETNGFMISWEAGDEWGQFQFPSLAELRLHRRRWVNGEMPTEVQVSHLPVDVGAELLRQMRVWLPFDESGSGDLMCVDCDSGWVVEYDHEWGNPTERNGSVFATSLTNHIRKCSDVCFHNIWLAGFGQIVPEQNCWTDWSSGNISKRYIVRD